MRKQILAVGTICCVLMFSACSGKSSDDSNKNKNDNAIDNTIESNSANEDKDVKNDENGKEGVPFEELEQMTLGSLRRAVVEGDVKMGSVMAGQSAGLVKAEMSCHDLIQKLVKETDNLLKGTGVYE